MRLYIIRHADPDYANDALTPLGHKQAEALAARLDTVRLDRIYASPMGRAQLTASYTAKHKGLPIQTLPWTRELGHWQVEWSGEAGPERACAWDVHGHVIRGAPRLPGVDDWHEHPPFNNPTFREEYDQIVGFSDALFAEYGYTRREWVYRFTRRSDAQIAVFCHGGFGLTWLSHLLAIPLPTMWAGFFLSPSSVTTILMDERCDNAATPRCLTVADTAHLLTAGLQDDQPPSGVRARHYY